MILNARRVAFRDKIMSAEEIERVVKNTKNTVTRLYGE